LVTKSIGATSPTATVPGGKINEATAEVDAGAPLDDEEVAAAAAAAACCLSCCCCFRCCLSCF